MVKHMIFTNILMVCGLILLAGCSGKTPGLMPGEQEQQGSLMPTGATESAEIPGQSGGQNLPGQSEAESGQENAEGQTVGSITMAEAKAAALGNAGLLEEEVQFVRVHLDSESGSSTYDLEFISADAAYDYRVSAVTGEILSMNCEMGDYDLESVPQGTRQAVATQSGQGTIQSAQGATQPAPEGTQPAPEATQPVPEATQPAPEGTQSGQGATQPVPEATQPGQGATQSAQGATLPAPETGTQEGQYIGLEAAKRVALEHAGLKEEEVRFAHTKLELEDGIWQYDVEFYLDSTRMEYDYDIDALTGEIRSFDHDAEHHSQGAGGVSPVGDGQITGDRAKQIALEYAGVAEKDAQYLEVSFDYDDGRAGYEIEWHVGRTEYSCDVDAVTGEVLSFEKEFD